MTYQFVEQKEIKVVTKNQGATCNVNIPKYMLVGLRWLNPHLAKEQIPVFVRVLPEFGEIVISHREVKPSDLSDFLMFGYAVPKNNPIRKIVDDDKQEFNDAVWMASEDKIKERTQRVIDAKKEHLAQLDAMEKDYASKIKMVQDHKKSLKEDLKKFPQNKKQWEQFIKSEKIRWGMYAKYRDTRGKKDEHDSNYLEVGKDHIEVRHVPTGLIQAKKVNLTPAQKKRIAEQRKMLERAKTPTSKKKRVSKSGNTNKKSRKTGKQRRSNK